MFEVVRWKDESNEEKEMAEVEDEEKTGVDEERMRMEDIHK